TAELDDTCLGSDPMLQVVVFADGGDAPVQDCDCSCVRTCGRTVPDVSLEEHEIGAGGHGLRSAATGDEEKEKPPAHVDDASASCARAADGSRGGSQVAARNPWAHPWATRRLNRPDRKRPSAQRRARL